MRSLDENIKKRLQRYYELKRTIAEKKHAQYLEGLYQDYPEIKDFENKRTEYSLNKIRANIKRENQKVQYYTEQILEIDQQLNIFLQENNIPLDYEKIKYECSFCQDTGWYHNDYCVCTEAALKILNQQDNPFAPPENMVFSAFDASIFSDKREKEFFCGNISPNEAIKGIKKMFTVFIDNFDQNFKNFYLFGSPGTGKTFMMACVANALREKGINVIFIKAVQLFEIMAKRRILLNSFNPDPVEQDTVRRIIDLIWKSEILCIDDLGLGAKGISNTYADFIALLDERLNSGLSTLITSNLKPKELANEYDERIGSRITGNYDLTPFEGKDVRREMAQTRKNKRP